MHSYSGAAVLFARRYCHSKAPPLPPSDELSMLPNGSASIHIHPHVHTGLGEFARTEADQLWKQTQIATKTRLQSVSARRLKSWPRNLAANALFPTRSRGVLSKWSLFTVHIIHMHTSVPMPFPIAMYSPAYPMQPLDLLTTALVPQPAPLLYRSGRTLDLAPKIWNIQLESYIHVY